MGHWNAGGSGQDWQPGDGTHIWGDRNGGGGGGGGRPMRGNMGGNMGGGGGGYKGGGGYSQPGGHGNREMRSRMLQRFIEMGFKKEDAQQALINHNMDYDRALGELRGGGRKDEGGPDGMGKPLLPPHSGMPQQSGNPSSLGPGLMPGLPVPAQKAGGPGVVRPGVPNAVQQQQLLQQQQLVTQLRAAVNKGLISPQVLQQPLSPQLLNSVAQLLQTVQAIQQFKNNLNQLQMRMAQATMPPQQRANLAAQVQDTQVRIQVLHQNFQQLTSIINSGRAANQGGAGGMLPQGGAAASPQTPASSLHTSASMPEMHQNMPGDMAVGGGKSQQSKLHDWKISEASALDDGPDAKYASLLRGTATPPTSGGPGNDLIPEFVPGKPWQGISTKNPMDDENLTPAMAAAATLSRLSLTPTAETLEQLRDSRGGMNTRPGQQGRGGAPGRSQQPMMPPGGGGGGWGVMSPTLIINAQADMHTVRLMCEQQGRVVAFQPAGQPGQFVVRYASADDALKARTNLGTLPSFRVEMVAGEQQGGGGGGMSPHGGGMWPQQHPSASSGAGLPRHHTGGPLFAKPAADSWNGMGGGMPGGGGGGGGGAWPPGMGGPEPADYLRFDAGL